MLKHYKSHISFVAVFSLAWLMHIARTGEVDLVQLTLLTMLYLAGIGMGMLNNLLQEDDL